ncbi:hypothetical protein [Lihuaxuella thermophila]|uniref:Uncharacterized protein n=1 Tax=Lihuaxuella thermophila TaxID=1173111 RepID=A0A1H8JGF5_9BACL|nr:hypothetical protein [Lihuaxuella thermophila]SEN79297.1 hypothetical protein SAMN05444955_12430 [Lihuaxuella thermophila]
MYIRFQTPYQYVFIHRNVKHLLLLWKKERKRDLYIIEEENDCMLLRFPGQTYVEMVLDEIEPIFFQRLETDDGPFPAILGATFTFGDKRVGMYYHPDHPSEALYFFEIQGNQITDIPDEEYEAVVRAFMNEFPEFFVGT